MPLYEIYLLTLASFSHASSPSDTLRTIPFNQYDAKACIRRQSLLGRYRLDPNTGAPLNPMGRTGLLGKGLLPRWGPNHVIVIVVTRWMRDPKNGSPIQRTNRNVLQFVALERSKRYCIPWYLTDHHNKCDFEECVPNIVRDFIMHRARANCPERRVDRLLKRIERAEVSQESCELVEIFKGYLDDQLNADSAWMETVVLNLHEGEGKGSHLTNEILNVFVEHDLEEKVKWMEVAHNANLRTSHNYILKSIAEIRRAFF